MLVNTRIATVKLWWVLHGQRELSKMVVAGCVVPRGNEDVSSLCLFFFFFLDRVCIFIRCDDTVLKLGRCSIKLGTRASRFCWFIFCWFFRMMNNVNIYGDSRYFFFFFRKFLIFWKIMEFRLVILLLFVFFFWAFEKR